MKKIYRTIVLLGMMAIGGTSCSDWLNVSPSDQIKEEFLFETGNGYRAALNGIYRKMASFSVYGSNLKWGLIDAWGQVYDIDLAPGSDGGEAMKKIEKLDFKNHLLTPTTDKMWNDTWNIVANCNELAQQAEKEENSLFYDGERERKMILGEAIALRAYIQFDLLRIYAPSPAMNPGERTFIPYINEYPAYISNRQTVAYCLEQIVKDLKMAQDILLTVDNDVNWNNRFLEAANDVKMFLGTRGYRMNYYAVTAALARVYLYAGKFEEAYAQAKIVIEKGVFEALTGNQAVTTLKKGNIKLVEDVIFALYSPRDQVDWDRLINHSSDRNEGAEGDERFLGITKTMAEERYGDDMDTDWRLGYQMEERTSSANYRSVKYYQQPESFSYAIDNNRLVPMIRMSEVYYIAAEAIYMQKQNGGEGDLKEAVSYLEKVKKGRGITVELDEMTTTDFMNVLVNDAQREFFGEGQTFFMFKRLLKPMKGRVEVAANEKNMVLPLPDTENSI